MNGSEVFGALTMPRRGGQSAEFGTTSASGRLIVPAGIVTGSAQFASISILGSDTHLQSSILWNRTTW